MKAITLWQPWASAIGRLKFIETRSWRTNHRGDIAIHAAARTPNGYGAYFEALYRETGIHRPPLGAVIAIANLVDVVPVEKLRGLSDRERFWGDYSAGRYGWILEDVRFLQKPAPANGRQQLWEWDAAGIWMPAATAPPVGQGASSIPKPA